MMSISTGNDSKNWEMILDLSASMLESAERKDWESLTVYMNAREKLMHSYFSIPLMRAEEIAGEKEERRAAQSAEIADAGDNTEISDRIEVLRQQIEHIKKGDRLIIGLTAQNKDLLARELLQLQKARKMVAGYIQQ